MNICTTQVSNFIFKNCLFFAPDGSSSGSLFSIQKFTHLVRSSPSAAFFLMVNLLAGLPTAILYSMFAVIVVEKFQLTADENGYFLSFQGIISIVSASGANTTSMGVNPWAVSIHLGGGGGGCGIVQWMDHPTPPPMNINVCIFTPVTTSHYKQSNNCFWACVCFSANSQVMY